MTPPSLPVSVLRDAVAREASSQSLRRAAREIGISPNGLRNFLNGAPPRLFTRAKLERWLAGRPTQPKSPTVGQLVRLLHALSVDLPPQQTAILARQIAAQLSAAYAERRLTPPPWARQLARLPEPSDREYVA